MQDLLEYQSLTFLFFSTSTTLFSSQGLCLLHHQGSLSLVWDSSFLSVGLLGHMPTVLPLPVPKATVLLNFSFKCLNAIPMEEGQGYLPHFIKLHYMSQPKKRLLWGLFWGVLIN